LQKIEGRGGGATSKILTDVLSENGLGILFLGFAFEGMELGPPVGWRLNALVVTNCVGFEWTDGWAKCLTADPRGQIAGFFKSES
jgi:hypothetical protein